MARRFQDLSLNRLKHKYNPSNLEGGIIDKQIVNARVIIIIWAAQATLYRYIAIMRLLIIRGQRTEYVFLSRLDTESGSDEV